MIRYNIIAFNFLFGFVLNYVQNIKDIAKSAELNIFIEKLKRYRGIGKTIVYLDESGFAQSMPRTHGYTLKVFADIPAGKPVP